MEIRMVKDLFREGIFRSATVVPVLVDQERWNLVLERKNGEVLTLTKARSSIHKRYKRVHSALIDARDIGFKAVKIELENSQI